MNSINSPHLQVWTRSRTLLFLSFRDTRSSSTYPPRLSRYKGKQRQRDGGEHEEAEALLGHEDMVSIDVEESSALPPKWVDYSEEVDAILEEVRPKMVQLDKLMAKHVLPGFTDRSSEEREIEALSNEITRGFRHCQRLIRKIAECGHEIEAYIRRLDSQVPRPARPRHTTHEVTMVKNVQIALATKVQGLSSSFQKRSRLYLQQIRGFEDSCQAERSPSKFVIGEEEEEAAEAGSSGRQQQEQIATHGHGQDGMAARQREIEGIAQSMSELGDMFRELGRLVLDQGTLLDRVDFNIEQMGSAVGGARAALEQAQGYQSRTGKCRLILLLLLLILGAGLVLVYKPRRARAVPPPVTAR